MQIGRPLLQRSGPIARLLRYPNPLKRPWKGKTIELARDAALGDVLMCTPVLREVKRRNPHCYIRFYTKFGPLVNGLPHIDEVLRYDQKPAVALYMGSSTGLQMVAERLGVPRFVDELRQQGYPVLTIDKDRGGKFGPTGEGGIPLEC